MFQTVLSTFRLWSFLRLFLVRNLTEFLGHEWPFPTTHLGPKVPHRLALHEQQDVMVSVLSAGSAQSDSGLKVAFYGEWSAHI